MISFLDLLAQWIMAIGAIVAGILLYRTYKAQKKQVKLLKSEVKAAKKATMPVFVVAFDVPTNAAPGAAHPNKIIARGSPFSWLIDVGPRGTTTKCLLALTNLAPERTPLILDFEWEDERMGERSPIKWIHIKESNSHQLTTPRVFYYIPFDAPETSLPESRIIVISYQTVGGYHIEERYRYMLGEDKWEKLS